MANQQRQLAYDWYLSTPAWRKRSRLCKVRAHGICQHCHKRKATQAHHLTYERVFDEDPNDLVALCDKCHRALHWLKPANDNQIGFEFSMPREYEEEQEGD